MKKPVLISFYSIRFRQQLAGERQKAIILLITLSFPALAQEMMDFHARGLAAVCTSQLETAGR
nr:hypothetical protein [Evansella caseinilytica]